MFQLVNLVSIKRTRTVIATLASALLMLAANASAQSEVVLKASSPSAKAGKWAILPAAPFSDDPTATETG
jgi:invasion protein IalB